MRCLILTLFLASDLLQGTEAIAAQSFQKRAGVASQRAAAVERVRKAGSKLARELRATKVDDAKARLARATHHNRRFYDPILDAPEVGLLDVYVLPAVEGLATWEPASASRIPEDEEYGPLVLDLEEVSAPEPVAASEPITSVYESSDDQGNSMTTVKHCKNGICETKTTKTEITKEYPAPKKDEEPHAADMPSAAQVFAVEDTAESDPIEDAAADMLLALHDADSLLGHSSLDSLMNGLFAPYIEGMAQLPVVPVANVKNLAKMTGTSSHSITTKTVMKDGKMVTEDEECHDGNCVKATVTEVEPTIVTEAEPAIEKGGEVVY